MALAKTDASGSSASPLNSSKTNEEKPGINLNSGTEREKPLKKKKKNREKLVQEFRISVSISNLINKPESSIFIIC